MSRSGDPHQPLRETIYKMKRTLEIYEARLSNGVLVVSNKNKWSFRNPCAVFILGVRQLGQEGSLRSLSACQSVHAVTVQRVGTM